MFNKPTSEAYEKKINLKTLRNENPSTWQVNKMGLQYQRTIDNLITDTGSLTLFSMPAPTHNMVGLLSKCSCLAAALGLI